MKIIYSMSGCYGHGTIYVHTYRGENFRPHFHAAALSSNTEKLDNENSTIPTEKFAY